MAARAFSTASVSPSRMSTLPRSVSVQSRRCSRILRCASCSPASVRASLLLSRSMTVRDTGRHLQPPRRPRTRSLSFLPSARPATLGLSQPITLPMSLGVTASVAATAFVHQRLELGVGELLGHVALEEPLLVALLVGEVHAAGPLVQLDRLGAPLALALEHGELVRLRGLLAAVDALLLERGDERVERLPEPLVARLERRRGVVLDALFDGAELPHTMPPSRVPPMTCQCRCMTSWPACGPVFVMTR